MPTSEVRAQASRRGVLRGALALTAAAATAVLPSALWAQATGRAQALVASLSEEFIALLRSGRSDAQLYGDFERLLARYADMPVVAASVLGPPWRGASATQKAAFVAAFQGYLARKYGRQFREYQDPSIEVVRARDAGAAGVLVETRFTRPGREPYRVEWQVSERGGAAKVINLIIEGVSMLTNERAEVGALLEAEGGDIDRLTAQMRATA